MTVEWVYTLPIAFSSEKKIVYTLRLFCVLALIQLWQHDFPIAPEWIEHNFILEGVYVYVNKPYNQI